MIMAIDKYKILDIKYDPWHDYEKDKVEEAKDSNKCDCNRCSQGLSHNINGEEEDED